MSKLSDPGGAAVRWRLNFQGLTDAERATMETFFASAEGRLNPFVFLDPTDNLLAWSEELTASIWVKGPLLEITPGIPDPWGGNRAVRIYNAGGTTQSLQQTLAAPAWLYYCFSAYVRSDQAGNFQLFRTAASMNGAVTLISAPEWKRVLQTGGSEWTEESVGFGMSLEAGVRVDVCGLQVEAQPAASTYRRTTARSGVYPDARFEDDSLSLTAEGPDDHSCTVGVFASLAR